MPPPSVVAVRVKPWPFEVMVTVAPGIGAPFESMTRPLAVTLV